MVDINPQIIEAEIAQIGPQGIPGQAATITIGSVTTGAAGSSATVTNSGTSTAAVLDFVIPQGAKGVQGEQGQQGIQGLTGATGNGISSIAKIGTSGLVDTYRISLTDNTYYDFTVTNGSSISDIEKTSTSGLVDTYTITLTNGNTHTFTVTNGAEGEKGETGDVGNGILNILKMSTTGLVDNYRINFTNGTYFDFDVTNALSIQSIAKLSTSGLVDTYRITFNDSTYFDFPVTNGRGITGVTLLSWEGLDKTYRMSFNDGSYFDFVVTNGTGQVDWGGISGILSQQADLQEALVQSNGLTTGSVSTYNVMLDELIERAHSTFDKSKFTIVGSPNITNDGVASGFSSSNYLLTPTIDFRNANSFEIISPVFSAGTFSGSQEIMGVLDVGNQNGGFWIIITNSKIYMQIAFTDWSDNIASQKQTLTANTKYQAKITYTGSAYEFYYREENGEWISLGSTQSALKLSLLNHTIGIGKDAIQDSYFSNGTVDLKQLSITVDGVEVFNGNRTGIDTIKPDDYTVVGTPTISADGIVSGFSASNYLSTNTNANEGNDVEIYVKFKTGTITTAGFIISTRLGYYSNKRFYSRVGGEDYYSNVFAEENTEYLAHIYLKNQRYICEVSKDNGSTWLRVCDIEYSGNIDTTNYTLGQGSNFVFSGSIDLNAFKIYVDGNLVYQPCLKIPYTESKTGSKVVNAVYRDRVNDMAEQFGSANYYTLSDTDFTLPMGELYGMIGDKTLRDSYYNGVTYWELFSNRRLEQGGTCESGVEYTLPKPFADANYVLTIPYSSKTATSFIPSATGDFIAKGIGLL